MDININYIIIGLMSFINLILIAICIKVFMSNSNKSKLASELERLERNNREDSMRLRQELSQSLLHFNDSVRKSVEERIDTMRSENTQNLSQMRSSVEEKMNQMQKIVEKYSK